MDIFSIIMLALAAYVLYAAIAGKGNLYDTSNVKEGQEKQYKKTMRLFYAGLGVEMLLNSASSIIINMCYTETVDGSPVVQKEAVAGPAFLSHISGQFFVIFGYVMFGLMVVTIVLMMVMMRKFIDKEKQQKAREAAQNAGRGDGHILPTSAFEFDENGELKPDRQEEPETEEEKEFKAELAAITNEELEEEIIDNVEEEAAAAEDDEMASEQASDGSFASATDEDQVDLTRRD